MCSLMTLRLPRSRSTSSNFASCNQTKNVWTKVFTMVRSQRFPVTSVWRDLDFATGDLMLYTRKSTLRMPSSASSYGRKAEISSVLSSESSHTLSCSVLYLAHSNHPGRWSNQNTFTMIRCWCVPMIGSNASLYVYK